jgi:hypothetical protein
VPAPFGWNPVDFWVPILTLGASALLMAIGIPLSVRRWSRTDGAERERIAGVLRNLAAELGGEFIGPRDVLGVTEDGEEYGPVPDYGTALVKTEGLAVEVGIQVMGGPNAKSLRVWVPLPPGRAWTVAWLNPRVLGWPRGDPYQLRTFLRRYRSADPERLSQDARAALLNLLRHAADVKLDAGGLTVWALPAGRRATPYIRGVTDAALLVPHVRRTVGVARLLLGA